MTPEELAAEHGCQADVRAEPCQCGVTTAHVCAACGVVLMVQSGGRQECVHVGQLTKALTAGAGPRPFVAWTGGGLFSHGDAR